MFSATKFNRGGSGRKFPHTMPEGAPFKKLGDLEMGKPVIVRGFYFNKKSKFGKEPVALTDDAYINLPKHLSEAVEIMIDDVEAVDAINAGCVGFKPYSYDNDGKTCYSVEWVDIVPTVSAEFPEIPVFGS